MKTELLFREKLIRDGYIREMTVWRILRKSSGCRRTLRYRFYFGRNDGDCLVRYDNERDSGDQKYVGGGECPHQFRNLEKVLDDFNADIAAVLKHQEDSS